MSLELTKSGENPEPQLKLPVLKSDQDDTEQRTQLTRILRLEPQSEKHKHSVLTQTDSNVAAVRRYLQVLFSGRAANSDIRDWLTDDFTFRDPLMSADSAEDYVNQLKAFGGKMELEVEVRGIVGEGDSVAALIDFPAPTGLMAYSLWFTFRDRKLARLQAVYDPRPILVQRLRMS